MGESGRRTYRPMSSIVLDLQAEAMNHTGSVLGLLRKTFAIATKLSIVEVKQWASSEMEGYQADVPEYRQFKGTVKWFNPVQGWQPVAFHGKKALEHKANLTAVPIFNPVAEIEVWMSDDGEFLEQTIDIEYARALGVPGQMSVFVAKSAVAAIPDRIRSYILKWSLELEAKGILGEGMRFNDGEKKQAPNVTTNYFFAPQYQNNGQLGAMGDSAAVNVHQPFRG